MRKIREYHPAGYGIPSGFLLNLPKRDPERVGYDKPGCNPDDLRAPDAAGILNG